jgi:hypothetical protein
VFAVSAGTSSPATAEITADAQDLSSTSTETLSKHVLPACLQLQLALHHHPRHE